MARLTIAAAIAACALCAGTAGAQELRIGFLNTTTGSGALLGRHLENGWKLGLEHHGWTKDGDALGGVPTRIWYADDQTRPETGLREVEKFLKENKVHIVSGIIWTNVMMAVQKPVFEAKALLLGANSGPSPLAGPLCNPLFVSASFFNDGNSEAIGELANRAGIKTFVAMAPNYQGGKEMLAGFERTYKGRIAETILFKLGESDFQADFTRLRALKPEGLTIFAPGAMGVAFMKQWVASGLSTEIKLYSINTIDNISLPAVGDAALGAVEAHLWVADLDIPKNKRFVAGYVARFGHLPSHLSVSAYDAVTLAAEGVRATGGKTDDMLAVARAMRKGKLDSPRGTLAFNVNGFLIQPYWKVEVIKGPEGKPLIATREKIGDRTDPYWERCPAGMRL